MIFRKYFLIMKVKLELYGASRDLSEKNFIEFNLDKLATQYSLQLDNEKIRYDALVKENQLLIEKKDLEIQTLQETLKKKSPFNKWLWFGAGGIAGASATVLIAKQFME